VSPDLDLEDIQPFPGTQGPPESVTKAFASYTLWFEVFLNNKSIWRHREGSYCNAQHGELDLYDFKEAMSHKARREDPTAVIELKRVEALLSVTMSKSKPLRHSLDSQKDWDIVKTIMDEEWSRNKGKNIDLTITALFLATQPPKPSPTAIQPATKPQKARKTTTSEMLASSSSRVAEMKRTGNPAGELVIRWLCKEATCPNRNNHCWIDQGLHYKFRDKTIIERWSRDIIQGAAVVGNPSMDIQRALKAVGPVQPMTNSRRGRDSSITQPNLSTSYLDQALRQGFSGDQSIQLLQSLLSSPNGFQSPISPLASILQQHAFGHQNTIQAPSLLPQPDSSTLDVLDTRHLTPPAPSSPPVGLQEDEEAALARFWLWYSALISSSERLLVNDTKEIL
jgi:hypothetical protein